MSGCIGITASAGARELEKGGEGIEEAPLPTRLRPGGSRGTRYGARRRPEVELIDWWASRSETPGQARGFRFSAASKTRVGLPKQIGRAHV